MAIENFIHNIQSGTVQKLSLLKDLVHLEHDILSISDDIDSVIPGLCGFLCCYRCHLSLAEPMWPMISQEHFLHDLLADIGYMQIEKVAYYESPERVTADKEYNFL